MSELPNRIRNLPLDTGWSQRSAAELLAREVEALEKRLEATERSLGQALRVIEAAKLLIATGAPAGRTEASRQKWSQARAEWYAHAEAAAREGGSR